MLKDLRKESEVNERFLLDFALFCYPMVVVVVWILLKLEFGFYREGIQNLGPRISDLESTACNPESKIALD